MTPFTQDASYFFATIYGGIVVGMLFDIYKVIKSNFKFIKYCSLVFDALFWILTTITVFITVNAIESFELRYYHFVALFLGFILYYNTISKFVLTIMNKILYILTTLIKNTIKYIVSILKNLYYVMIYTLHFLFDMIFYIPNMIVLINRGVKRKTLGKIKIRKKV
ncbi:spore cortex biosynthesis protein YabQ [Romboutsia sp. 1001713B170131_170501_G6]|uniref:spore cortex biosynthesis protein YabQ n=1 Tax=Romboutsia sp. 1001713B170131_170501_G6 TaxID=2787108 RepID=UPI0018ABB0B8|nr:spore cortex biosynthesis protein YabQ [Romboutsia sp. 1001713B170131_170501_G6]